MFESIQSVVSAAHTPRALTGFHLSCFWWIVRNSGKTLRQPNKGSDPGPGIFYRFVRDCWLLSSDDGWLQYSGSDDAPNLDDAKYFITTNVIGAELMCNINLDSHFKLQISLHTSSWEDIFLYFLEGPCQNSSSNASLWSYSGPYWWRVMDLCSRCDSDTIRTI